MKKNRIKKEKGFTLVELIVVLVILAILAAMLIPALTGWITKAKEKSALAYARAFYTSVQSVCSEEYGQGLAFSDWSEDKSLQNTYEAITNTKPEPDDRPEHARIKKIYNLMEIGSSGPKFEAIARVERGVVTVMRFKNLELNRVYEWKKESPEWKKMDNPSNSWAGEITPNQESGIWWNGYSPD